MDQQTDRASAHPQDAKQLPLANAAKSPQADGLVGAVLGLVERHENRTNRRGPKQQARLREAVAAFTGALLLHAQRHGTVEWAWIQTNATAFSGGPIGYRQFSAIRAAFRSARLIEELEGFTKFVDFGGSVGHLRFATRMRGTPALWQEATKHGIDLAAAGDHFARRRPDPEEEPVYIKALSQTIGKERIRGARLPLPTQGTYAAQLAQITADVREMNNFIGTRKLHGCDPVTLQRGFTVDLRHGGRWYARGDSYQTLPKEQRLAIQIDGEAVAEVDVRASHLTILHGLQGLQLPEGDPYEGLEFPREVVKAWVVATIGAGSPVVRWSRQTKDVIGSSIELSKMPAKAVGASVIWRFPFLAQLPNILGCSHEPRLCSLRLMNIEAEALTVAMQHMRRARGVFALPMHDSLLLPRSAARAGGEALRLAFRAAAGVMPVVQARTAGEGSCA